MQSAQEYPAGQGCPQLSERQAVAAPGGGDNELSGWEARLQAPAARVAEFVELYSSLGYEVTTASIAPSSFSPECASCASMCEPDVIVYTRRPARADDSHTRQGQAPLEVPGEQ